MKGVAWLVQVIIVFLVCGCSNPHRVPVQDRSRAESLPASSSYTVRKGDTLYAIAFRYGLDYRTLARINGINSSYRIFPGQSLRLKPSSQSVVKQKATSSKPVTKTVSQKATRAASGVKVAERSSVSSVPVKATSKPVAKTASTKPVHSAPAKKVPQNQKTTSASASAAAIRWRWPSQGKLLAGFRTKGKVNKGINLAGNTGDPVYAAASGDVVYAGSGLLGYGNLVIIDHNQKYLSAYAHNSRVLVKESDKVKAGEKIAEMGRSGADRVMLHFEIRRDGVPVNPLKYLPKKQ